MTTTADSGPGSLRAAIAAGGLVTFAPEFFDGRPRTIQLLSPLTGSRSIDVLGPGADALVIDAGGDEDFIITSEEHRVLEMSAPSVSLRGLTLTSGTGRPEGFFRGGGCLAVSGDLTIVECLISGGRTQAIDGARNGNGDADGGGIFHRGGRLVMTDCVVTGNAISGDFSQGGGVYTEGMTALIQRCRITGNTTNGSVGEGGGLATRAETEVRNCEFSLNETLGPSSGGGGVYSDTDFVAVQCSFFENVVGRTTGVSGYSVGGAFANVGGTAHFDRCTITDNSAPTGDGQGGGISSLSRETLSFRSSIIAGNQNSDIDRISIRTPFRDDGHNLFGFGSGVENLLSPDESSSRGITAADLMLEQSAFNGGPTLTLLPSAQSVATGRGAPLEDAETMDSRGLPRLSGTDPDVGAVERQFISDSDNDGIPDDIESNFTSGLEPGGDEDNDGLSNSAEFQLSDPQAIADPTLRFQLEIQPAINGLTLSFPYRTGRSFTLEGSQTLTLATSSDALEPSIRADQTFRRFIPLNSEKEFFRVRAEVVTD